VRADGGAGVGSPAIVLAILLLACAHGSAEHERTTHTQQERMRERANAAAIEAPSTARMSGRHGPSACLKRWQYESESKFDTCLANWQSTEARHAQGNTRADRALEITAAVAGVAVAARQPTYVRVLCNDREWSPSCVDDGNLQGCCSQHDGVLVDGSGAPIVARE
jgi:hypothetical protein